MYIYFFNWRHPIFFPPEMTWNWSRSLGWEGETAKGCWLFNIAMEDEHDEPFTSMIYNHLYIYIYIPILKWQFSMANCWITRRVCLKISKHPKSIWIVIIFPIQIAITGLFLHFHSDTCDFLRSWDHCAGGFYPVAGWGAKGASDMGWIHVNPWGVGKCPDFFASPNKSSPTASRILGLCLIHQVMWTNGIIYL